MTVEGPAIFLSFDDHYPSEWREAAGRLAAKGWRVTFFPSLKPATDGGYWTRDEIARNVPASFWADLLAIRAAGHVIGFHGVNHVRSDAAASRIGASEWWERDVQSGLDAMAEHGLVPIHWAYPYGIDSADMDALLLWRFKTLRTAPVKPEDVPFYDPEALVDQRSFASMDLREVLTFRPIERLERDGGVLFIHGHNPAPHVEQLRYILRGARRIGATLHTFDELV